jgi:hypothetical protein
MSISSVRRRALSGMAWSSEKVMGVGELPPPEPAGGREGRVQAPPSVEEGLGCGDVDELPSSG